MTTHPYLPTHEQMEAMDSFVDAMDLMQAGEKDDDGYYSQLFPSRQVLQDLSGTDHHGTTLVYHTTRRSIA